MLSARRCLRGQFHRAGRGDLTGADTGAFVVPGVPANFSPTTAERETILTLSGLGVWSEIMPRGRTDRASRKHWPPQADYEEPETGGDDEVGTCEQCEGFGYA